MVHPKQLIVEGTDDLSAISNLVQQHIDGFKNGRDYLVEMKSGDGVENILVDRYIRNELSQARLQAIGFVIDADDAPQEHWQSFRNFVAKYYENVPENLPADGLILEQEGKPRLGFWMMPDCRAKGMLEDFLRLMVPGHDADKLWLHARTVTEVAKKEHGAPYIDAHKVKAEIHTWLAWQNEPGKRFGAALAAKILDPNAESARPFLCWFAQLFQLPLLSAPSGDGAGAADARA